jgi:hypothetical protein
MNAIQKTQNNDNIYTVSSCLNYLISIKSVSIGVEAADGIFPVELDALSERGGGDHENL